MKGEMVIQEIKSSLKYCRVLTLVGSVASNCCSWLFPVPADETAVLLDVGVVVEVGGAY